MKSLFIAPCQASRTNHSFRIVSVDVNDWNANSFGNITTVARGSSTIRRSCVSNLVVYYQVERTTNTKMWHLAERKSFLNNSLPFKKRFQTLEYELFSERFFIKTRNGGISMNLKTNNTILITRTVITLS